MPNEKERNEAAPISPEAKKFIDSFKGLAPQDEEERFRQMVALMEGKYHGHK